VKLYLLLIKRICLRSNKDLGAFTIPCVIGNVSFKRALCDLGVSISVIPKHVYDSLSLEPLIKTSIVIPKHVWLFNVTFIFLIWNVIPQTTT
jgi:hypothetical protein